MELKKNDFLLILQVLSIMIRMYGVSLIIPAIVAFYFSESSAANSFFITSIIIVISTSSIIFILKNLLKDSEVKVKHTMICLALAWIIISLFSMIPFLQINMTFVDAFFESMSGWTGTGFSMFQDPSSLPHSINFFRGYIQWVGGFGIVILALLFYAKPVTAQRLFVAEGRAENFFFDVKKIARLVVSIFLFYTVLGAVSLFLIGVPFFEAIIHTLTSISTGGFSTNSIGIGAYGAGAMFIGILLMLCGAISFTNHYEILTGNFKKFFKNPEIIFMAGLIFFSALIIFLEIWFMKSSFFYDAFFYIISALTGTGAGTNLSITSFNQISIIILIFLMVCGATYGSTTGAIKLWRILIVSKIIKREVTRHFLPEHAVIPIKMGNQVITDDQALKITAYSLLYFSLLFIGSMIFMLSGYSTLQSVFLVASAQGNVGLNILPETAYFGMNPLLKLLLNFHMLLGRIEIFPFLILLKGLIPGKKGL